MGRQYSAPMKNLACLVAALAVITTLPASAAEPWANPIVKKGYLNNPLVEVTPLVFKDRLYRLESWQKYWDLPGLPPPNTRSQEDAVRVWDVAADKLVSTPLVNHGFATALVWDGLGAVAASSARG